MGVETCCVSMTQGHGRRPPATRAARTGSFRPTAEALWRTARGFNLRGMKYVLRMALCAALMATACRRPAPEDPWAWEKNPGLDPHPTGQTLAGKSGPPLGDMTFRLDPARGTSAALAEVEPATEEEALYLKAAKDGQAWAQTKLGIRYVQDESDMERLGEGLRWLNAAADQNDIEALRALSALATEGRGVDQSDKEAYVYMRRAAELGSAEAQYELANTLANGRGMPRDMEAALIWAKKAAFSGHVAAQHSAGVSLLRRAATPQDISEGVELLRKAAASNHREAIMVLAGVLTRGEFGLAKDENQAELLLMPRAEGGDAEMQFGLATLYLYGQSFTSKREKGMEWLEKSAAAGFEKSQKLLSELKQSQFDD